MRIPLMVSALLAALPSPAFAQSQPTSTAQISLAAGRLASVVDIALFFRLYKVSLPAGQRSSYSGSTAILYVLSGAPTIDLDGTVQSLAEGAGTFMRSISRKASKPPSEDRWPPSKRATTALPCTGDRPGRNGLASTMAGAAPVGPRVQAHHQNPTPNQHVVLHPPALTHNPG